MSARIAGGTFSIAGGNPGQEVSWQVTGVRRAAWANAHRIPVVADKPEQDRGRFVHPELFGGAPITRVAIGRAHVARIRSRRRNALRRGG